MSRSHKKFPCRKICLRHGKKIANKMFRNVCKDKMRHHNYDMLPTKSKEIINSYNVCDYKSISNQLISGKSPYYKCQSYGFFYDIISSLSNNADKYFFYALKFTKFDLYKTFIMK